MSIPASPLVCLLGDLDGVTTDDNTIHMAFTALCIAKKTVLMNWKNKNNLNINQYRDYLWDYISLKQLLLHIRSISLGPLISSSPSVWGSRFCPAVVFVLAWGGNWAWGIWGFPGGGFLGGFGAGAALGLDGVLVTLGAVFWRHAALLGMPVPADVGCQPGGRTVPGWSGGVGVLGALCLRVGVTAGPGGLGSWLVCRREHGLVHALGPGSGVGVFDASVPPQGGVQ